MQTRASDHGLHAKIPHCVGPWGRVKIGYLTVLWLLTILGVDQSVEFDRNTKIIVPGLNQFAWTDNNLSAPGYYPWRVIDAEPPRMTLLTLGELAQNVQTDQEVLHRILRYYAGIKEELRGKWGEASDARLQALFAMNLIHVSHPYGTGSTPVRLVEYARQTPTGSCRVYSIFQSRILDAFGLPWRFVAISSGFHGWIEVRIDGQWEIFDATANVWIDQSSFELLNGTPRRFRMFYSPWSDAKRDDAQRFVERYEPHYFTAGALRMNMPGLGVYYMTRDYLEKKGLAIEQWDKFCPDPLRGKPCTPA